MKERVEEGPVPWVSPPCPLYYGPFRLNVKQFLSTYGCPVQGLVVPRFHAHVVRLSTQQAGAVDLLLHVYEEKLTAQSNTTCDACRNMGECELKEGRGGPGKRTAPAGSVDLHQKSPPLPDWGSAGHSPSHGLLGPHLYLCRARSDPVSAGQ